MDTYVSCPKKYHYRYIEKPDVTAVKWSFTELGSCAHRVLEIFHERLNKEGFGKKDFSIVMKECFKAAVKEFDINILQEDTWMPQGEMPGINAMRIMIQDYLDLIRAQESMPNVIGVEVPYNFKLNENTIIRGYIDRLDFVEEGVYRVVDYKTSKNPKYLKEFQLLVYAEAIRRKYKNVKKVYGSYMMLKHGCDTKDYVFNISDMDRCKALLDERSSSISLETKWTKKPSILCKWCDYRSICQDAWAE
jgi:ATP-dependent helicase/DNAse subunit B